GEAAAHVPERDGRQPGGGDRHREERGGEELPAEDGRGRGTDGPGRGQPPHLRRLPQGADGGGHGHGDGQGVGRRGHPGRHRRPVAGRQAAAAVRGVRRRGPGGAQGAGRGPHRDGGEGDDRQGGADVPVRARDGEAVPGRATAGGQGRAGGLGV